MRMLVLAIAVAVPAVTPAQMLPASPLEISLQHALAGEWVGVLEYRDYSEPAASTKRVDLPTWLTIAADGKQTTWKYTYDDGPNKVIEETNTVSVDPAAKSWAESADGKPATVEAVDGFEELKEGRGVLVLHGRGIDNGRASEVRTTVAIHRNLLEITEEVRAAGSSEAFAFRHMYRFARAARPAATGTHK
jgi:hypothetical protein